MMPSSRKFYKTTFKVIVLSEGLPFDNKPSCTLYDIDNAIRKGDCMGDFFLDSIVEISPKEAALCLPRNSEPEFFGLTAEGEDLADPNQEPS